MNLKKIFKCKNSLLFVLLFSGIVLFACSSEDAGSLTPIKSGTISDNNSGTIPENEDAPALPSETVSDNSGIMPEDENDPDLLSETVLPGDGDLSSVDAISSATPSAIPGKFIRPLYTAHYGWGKSTCLASGCHPVNHDSRYTESNCVTCHGFNGTPNIPGTHNLSHDSGSHAECANAGCHNNEHPGQSFKSPVDCKACHRLAQTSTPSFTEEYDVVVIGAGGAGLSTAAILARAGLDVLVIEKHYRVGGMFGCFYRGDYKFESGLYGEVLREISLVLNMLGKFDVEEIMYSPTFMRLMYPDQTIDIPANPWDYERLLKKIYPEDAVAIGKIFDQLLYMTGAPWFLYSTTQTFFNKYTDNEELVSILGDVAIHMNVSLDEFAAPIFMFLFNGFNVGGYTYPVGTSQKFADSFAEIILEEGGRIELNTLATKIIVKDGTATEVWTNHGGRYRAKHIVSTANAEQTFLKLIGEEYLPDKLITALKGDENGEGKLEITEPIVNVYLGVDKDYTKYFPDGALTISVIPGYDPEENINSIKNCTVEKTRFGVANYSVLDPDMAPPGKNVICIAGQLSYDCPGGNKWFINDYNKYKQYKYQIARSYIDRAAEVPGLSDIRDHIEVLEVCSPHTTEGYTFSTRGAHVGYGFANDQLYNITRTYGVGTPIKNLYLTGQWASGGGAPLVVLGGMLTSSAIIAEDPAAADMVDFMVEGFDNTMYAWYKMFERIIINGSYYQ